MRSPLFQILVTAAKLPGVLLTACGWPLTLIVIPAVAHAGCRT